MFDEQVLRDCINCCFISFTSLVIKIVNQEFALVFVSMLCYYLYWFHISGYFISNVNPFNILWVLLHSLILTFFSLLHFSGYWHFLDFFFHL